MNDITKIFSTLIALIGASGSLHADTITVCPDGTCDFASVDEAITAAADGDRIEIASGVYDISQYQNLEERSIEIVGVAEPDEPAPRLQLTGNVSWRFGDLEYRIDSVEFVGEVEGVPTHRLRLGNSTLETNLHLQGCRFQGLKDQLIRVFTVDIDDCVFDNCFFDEYTAAFIYVRNASLEGCLFDSCVVGSGTSQNRHMILALDFEAVDTIVRNCEFRYANNEWFRSYDAGSVVLRNCRFEENSSSYYGLVTIFGRVDALIEDCVFTGNFNAPGHAVGSITAVDTDSLLIRDCVFDDPAARCDDQTPPDRPGPRALGIFGGIDISIQDSDFIGGRGGIRRLVQSNLNIPIEPISVQGCRFINQGQGPAPDCSTPDPSTCPLGTAFTGRHAYPYDPPFDFPDPDVVAVFTDCVICGCGEVPMSGDWIDGGGNCITRNCTDLDEDGAADGCGPEPGEFEIHVPGEVATLGEALDLAVRGQSIILAPGDHELHGFRSLSAADLVVRAEVAIEGPSNTARIHLIEDDGLGLRILSSPGAGVRFENLDLFLPNTGGIPSVCEGSNYPFVVEGVIIAESSHLAFSGCRFFASSGRTAVAGQNASLSFDACEFLGETDGGLAVQVVLTDGDLEIDRSLLVGTRLQVEDATVSIARTRFTSISDPRGAMQFIGSTTILEQCEVIDTTVDGTSIGAVDVSRGRLLVRNCWFRGNRTAANSGAIRVSTMPSELSIAGSTFCDNQPADLDSPPGWTDLGGNAFDAEGCARMAGDLDGDGCITGADFGLLLQQWSVTSGSPADLNRDGVVDGGDIGVLFTNWGQCF